MELIKDTTLEHGVLYYPIRPPTASMLLVVKATFVLRDGDAAELAEPQDPASGELYHDDDPERSVRYPTDYALVKPRGECFVTGSCRPLTGGAVDRTMASFQIGSVQKSLAIYGDRRWVRLGMGVRASAPMPFTEMPLCWERSFGGPGFEANPLGRGIAPDAEGNVWLPNIELPTQPISDGGQRPPPATAFASSMSWKRRRQLMGTYDERWQRTRFPWLAEDFRFAFFNEAPEDQQIEGYWRGDEPIVLSHLHPTLPTVRSRLPAIAPRAFVEHAEDSPRPGKPGTFEEVRLALDTITVDADRGAVLCVWRGTLDLAHAKLSPEGLARLFVMDEPLSTRSSVEACRERMRRKIEGEEAATDALSGEEPPEVDEILTTMQEGPNPEIAAALAAAEAKAAADKVEADMAAGADLFAKVEAQMKAAGMDPAKLTADAEAHAPADPLQLPDLEVVKKAFEDLGQEFPPEIEQVFDEITIARAHPPEDPQSPSPPPRPDLRAIVIETHRARRALVGDFTGADLTGLDLSGLDARDAILSNANMRGTVLRRAKLDGASLVHTELLSADLAGASLRNADLTTAILEAADLEGANLDGATLERAELMEAKLDRATLRKADLTGALLQQASLIGAICDEARFDGAQMDGCNCTDASFVETRIYGARAQRMKMDRAILTRVRVGDGADLSGTTFRGVEGTGSRWMQSTLEGVDFSGAILTGADFTDAVLTVANLAGCRLEGAVFRGAVLRGAGLSRTNMFEGSLRQADLSGADLRGANLYGVDLFEARAEGVDLEGVNLDGTFWEGK